MEFSLQLIVQITYYYPLVEEENYKVDRYKFICTEQPSLTCNLTSPQFRYNPVSRQVDLIISR